jgi:hypothetical protein
MSKRDPDGRRKPAGAKPAKLAQPEPGQPSKPNGHGTLKAGVNLSLKDKDDELDKEFERY